VIGLAIWQGLFWAQADPPAVDETEFFVKDAHSQPYLIASSKINASGCRSWMT